jgi:fructose-1,6-bisphosphatase/inositol monophosphatase family enzyme
MRWKSHRDVVSGATIEVQDAILDVLRRETPDCGSLNYVQGIPYFGVSIPLRTEGAIRVGAVYDPWRDELFCATLGSHSTLNGTTIGVQQISEGYGAFEKAWVGTDWPHDREKLDQAMQIATIMSRQVIALNALGSPALGLCNVAAASTAGPCAASNEYWKKNFPNNYAACNGGLILLVVDVVGRRRRLSSSRRRLVRACSLGGR